MKTGKKRVTPPVTRKDASALTLSRRAHIALQLPPDWQPDTHMAELLQEVGIADVWPYLRHSDDPGAREMIKLRGELAKGEREAASVDAYIAAAGVDFHKLLGVISEQVSRIESSKAAIRIAVSAPKMVEMADFYGTTPDGHADRKMILQSSGVAPVPKNQVTNISVRDSVIDQRRQQAVSVQLRVPTLEEVVKDIDGTVYEREPDPRDAGPQHTIAESATDGNL